MKIVNKLKDLEEELQQITLDMLDLDRNAEENQGKVRIAWQQNCAPGWKIDEDICFLRITPINSPMARQLDILYEEKENSDELLNKIAGYTRVLQVDFCFYGPNSYDNADLVRFKLLSDEEIKKKLNKIHLYLNTDVSMPRRMPELFNNRWFDRTDFQCEFNELCIREKDTSKMVPGNIIIVESR